MIQRSGVIFFIVVGVVGVVFGFMHARPVSIFAGILALWAGITLLEYYRNKKH